MRAWEPVGITGWGIVSPIGIGAEAFTEGFRAGSSGRKPTAGLGLGVLPSQNGCVIPEFEADRFLGQKGTRFLDRTTLLAITACGAALRQSGLATTADNQTRIGIVLGTDVGSIKSTADFFRDTLVQPKPYMVEPAQFPNAVINCAASQSAIWHKLKGSIPRSRAAGWRGFRRCARRTHHPPRVRRRAPHRQCREFCEQTAGLLPRQTREGGAGCLLGEGCAMFTVEKMEVAADAGDGPGDRLACEVATSASARVARGRPDRGLAACIGWLSAAPGIHPQTSGRCPCSSSPTRNSRTLRPTRCGLLCAGTNRPTR